MLQRFLRARATRVLTFSPLLEASSSTQLCLHQFEARQHCHKIA